MLTSRSFILIHHVGERTAAGEEGRFFGISFRTEFSDRSDAHTLARAATDHAIKYAPELLAPAIK